jgi:hypothetical protein
MRWSQFVAHFGRQILSLVAVAWVGPRPMLSHDAIARASSQLWAMARGGEICEFLTLELSLHVLLAHPYV